MRDDPTPDALIGALHAAADQGLLQPHHLAQLRALCTPDADPASVAAMPLPDPLDVMVRPSVHSCSRQQLGAALRGLQNLGLQSADPSVLASMLADRLVALPVEGMDDAQTALLNTTLTMYGGSSHRLGERDFFFGSFGGTGEVVLYARGEAAQDLLAAQDGPGGLCGLVRAARPRSAAQPAQGTGEEPLIWAATHLAIAAADVFGTVNADREFKVSARIPVKSGEEMDVLVTVRAAAVDLMKGGRAVPA